MASFQSIKKAVNALPTVRTLPSGVPVAPMLNLAARAPSDGHGHGHGATAPRSDAPARFASNIMLSPSLGFVSKTYLNSMHTSFALRMETDLHMFPTAAPTTSLSTGRFLHTSAIVRDANEVPDFSDYQASSFDSNRGFSYFMVGTMGVLSASMAKSSITGFLETMAASADVLAMAKVEVDLGAIPEGKNVIIKWRGKPVFIRHRTEEEIEEARSTEWKHFRDPESDEERTKKPEWLVMLGVCTHLGCVPIGEAGDYGGWLVCFRSSLKSNLSDNS